jgi:hypothetical protein
MKITSHTRSLIVTFGLRRGLIGQGHTDQLMPGLHTELSEDRSCVCADGLKADLHFERDHGVRLVIT